MITITHTNQNVAQLDDTADKFLLLSADAIEVLPSFEGKIFAYRLDASVPLETSEYYQILHKFIAQEGIDKLAKLFRDLKTQIPQLQEQYTKSCNSIDSTILEVCFYKLH